MTLPLLALTLLLCAPLGLGSATLGPIVSLPALHHIRLTWEGEASYYHRKFQGRTMANGTRYDQGKLTAASRVGEFGDTLVVTRLDNGRTVTVICADRFGKDDPPERIVDLSQAAAKKLGIMREGWTKVIVTVKGE